MNWRLIYGKRGSNRRHRVRLESLNGFQIEIYLDLHDYLDLHERIGGKCGICIFSYPIT